MLAQESRDRMRLFALILTMVSVAVAMAGIWGWSLYKAAIDEQGAWLQKLVQSQARLIEAVAKSDTYHVIAHGKEYGETDAWSATMRQIAAGVKSNLAFGETGEFVFGRRNGDLIEFLLEQRYSKGGAPDPLPFNSKLATPMHHALSGHSGTIIGQDYRDATVLAAYEPVKGMDIGIVAKIDLVEVRAPFVKVSIYGALSALFVIGLGGILTHRTTAPLLKRLEGLVGSLNEAQRIANLGSWEWDVKTGDFDWSDQVYRIFGFAPFEIKATYDAFIAAAHPDDRDMVEEAISISLKEKNEYADEHRIIRTDGTERIVRVQGRVISSQSGEPVRMIGTALDITELRHAEREVGKLFQAIESSSILVMITDKKGVVEYINPSFSDVTGFSKEEMIGGNPKILKSNHTTKKMYSDLWKTIAAGKVWRGEFKNKCKDGRFFWASTTISPVVVAGQVTNYTCIQEDITERKQAEIALAATTVELKRSNKDLEQFAYVASHDLQEPLRAVASYTQLLARRYEGKLDEKADKYIRNAHEGASRMQRLIEGLLSFSRINTEGKKFASVNCNNVLELVQRNLDLAIEEAGAKIIVNDLPSVIGDERQLTMVFQNLISNAIKFRGDDPLRIDVSAERQGNEWCFSVADNGIGLEEEFIERIFVIFQRLHIRSEYPGEGLGLAICKQVAERHGGRIWVESFPGKGATFYFTLSTELRAPQ